MTFLPIIERELRARSRRPVTYWMRFAVGGFGTLLCLMQLNLGSVFGGGASMGRPAFHGLVTAAFLLCCVACVLTADAISSERREGTLGLLFLTYVRGPDVLLGKLVAAVLVGLCAVIAFLPVLMIPILSGGVTGGEAFRKGLVLLDTLFVSLTAGLWASARGEAWIGTVRKALLLMLAILLVPVVYGFAGLGSPLNQTFAAFSPIGGLLYAGDQAFNAAPGAFWRSLILVHLLGWLVLWRASRLVRQSLREPSAETVATGKLAVQTGVATAPGHLRKRLTDQAEPIRWLLDRQRGVALAVWAGVAIGVSYWLIIPLGIRLFTPGAGLQALLWPTSLVTQAAKAGLFAWVASRFFIEARRTGKLELLITTPHGATGIVSAQAAMLKRLFRWPIIVLLLPLLLQSFSILYLGLPGAWKIHYATSLVLSGITTWVHVMALCWVGMWFGLRARSQWSAIVWTVGLVGVLPHLLSWVFRLVAPILSRLMSSAVPTPFFVSSWLSSLLVLVFYFWLINRARKLLGGDLRLTELQPIALAKGLGDFWRDGTMAVRKARHWTPS